ncbi:class I SAM-dependent methyltransferase [Mycobacterium sp. IS-3022]|uniref:class I SAM-dependent methyltransferase n=1 Tax=Mycobacterium sp. IS-3022 TaxID=1772277 RepID=UPI0007418369|nr:class I SAM-dependent methyltransferase [Mycobacterium sp. IS-3022]KUI03973.1 SAM-dependent methyltransferase [Mycobacterium sp. IS-3022]
MTENHPNFITGAMGNRHDYLPAAGHDAFLPGYDLLTRLLGMNRVYDALISRSELADARSVLEVGCGTGNVSVRAKRRYPALTAVGCDPDPRALSRAQRKARGLTGIRFEPGYVQKLPYAEGEFDRVLSSMMWHHLDEDVKSEAAREILRVLRPGGRLYLVDVGGDMTADDGLAARRMLRSAHVAGNLGDAIPRLLRSVGFDCDEVDTQRHRFVGRLTYYRAVRPG